jgi:hypothetical protein
VYGGICIMMHFLFVHFSSGHGSLACRFFKKRGGEVRVWHSRSATEREVVSLVCVVRS